MTVSSKEYSEQKKSFFKKHNVDWKVETSQMDEYGVYYKTYVFEDGAIWYERMSPAWRSAEAEVEVVKGVKVKLQRNVKLFETEFFDSDNAGTRKYYEEF